ncbi:MAG: hypothetical protein ACF8CQ_01150 [Rhodopirellula sp. JB044]|uniref:hypothetical protein n=1 Tax=Rhodopirellula sp. JB044 TaxID=3342844 RepID=UPI00370B6FEC
MSYGTGKERRVRKRCRAAHSSVSARITSNSGVHHFTENPRRTARRDVVFCRTLRGKTAAFSPLQSLLNVILLTAVGAASVSAQAPADSAFAAESLARTPVTLSIEDQTLPTLIRQIFVSIGGSWSAPGNSQVNSCRSIWIDRQVDPTTTVSLTVTATSAAKVIVDLAEKSDLAVFPLPGVLVVGRPQWVDAAASFVTVGATDDDLISVRWPSGSTASEVLELILAAPKVRNLRAKVTDLSDRLRNSNASTLPRRTVTWLPHDVWPAGEFIGVDRTTAVSLVLAQFDYAIKPGTRLESLTTRSSSRSRGNPASRGAPSDSQSDLPSGIVGWSELTAGKPFSMSYPKGDSVTAIRETLDAQTVRSSVRTSGDTITVRATAENHRRALAAHWRSTAAAPSRRESSSAKAAVFDLKLINKAASDVLRQLAATDGKRFRIEPDAELASQRRINLDGKQKTLRELAVMVAESASLEVEWGEEEVVIRKP